MSVFPRLSPSALIQQVGERDGLPVFLVLDPDRPAWLLVNDDGRKILECCDGKHSAETIARKLAPNAFSQVESFLDLAAGHRLFTIEDELPPEPNRFRGVALELTSRCNLRCIHCYLDAGVRPFDELPLPALIEIIGAVKRAGGGSVAFGGGEPLLREDCFEAIDAALSRELLVSVGTNGTLLDKHNVSRLACRPLKIQVSLDGASAEVHDRMRGQGSFRSAVQGIDRLVEAGKGKDLCLAFTAVKGNVHEVPAIIEFALQRGIPVIQFPPLAAAGRARSRYNRLRLGHEELLEFWEYLTRNALTLKGKLDLLADCFSLSIDRVGTPYRCTIGTQYRIDPAGNVYPCQCFHGGEEFCLGNVTVTPLDEIVSGKRIREILRIVDARPQRIDQCRHCHWVNFCGSGCMGNAYEENGTIFMPQACEARKLWIERQFSVRLEKI